MNGNPVAAGTDRLRTISGADGPTSIAPRLRGNGNSIAEEQYKVTYDLQGKVVLITGAAGGIGAATARALHACGARLVLTDVTQASVDRLAAEFDSERTLALALDVTDAAATKAVVQHAVDRFGRLDIAFANAGISWHDVPATVYSCDEQEFERIVEVDLFGVWRTIKAALPEIVRNRGQVLVTASVYAFVNGMVNAPYAVPPDALKINSVRQRQYRGYCAHNGEAYAVAVQMRSQRPQVYAALTSTPGLDPKTAARATQFLDSFFADIASNDILKAKVLKSCL